jgi:hypothetical protein
LGYLVFGTSPQDYRFTVYILAAGAMIYLCAARLNDAGYDTLLAYLVLSWCVFALVCAVLPTRTRLAPVSL